MKNATPSIREPGKPTTPSVCPLPIGRSIFALIRPVAPNCSQLHLIAPHFKNIPAASALNSFQPLAFSLHNLSPKAPIVPLSPPKNSSLSVPKIPVRNAKNTQEHLRTPKKNSLLHRRHSCQSVKFVSPPLPLTQTKPNQTEVNRTKLKICSYLQSSAPICTSFLFFGRNPCSICVPSVAKTRSAHPFALNRAQFRHSRFVIGHFTSPFTSALTKPNASAQIHPTILGL
jgi:hypothetical protein